MERERERIKMSKDAFCDTTTSTLASNGWVCTSKEPVPGSKSVPGFAPPMRMQDVPLSRLVPTTWQEGPTDGNCAFTYRAPPGQGGGSANKATVTLKSLNMDGTVVLYFGVKDPKSLDLEVGHLCHRERGERGVGQVRELRTDLVADETGGHGLRLAA